MESTPSTPRFPVAVRADGVTPAERYLQRLCDRSFLSLWSYPSTFRDQKASGKGDGKELCDLLGMFGDDVLIFSDKSCSFPETGDTHLDWSRWFRRAVMKSAEQVWGAERWLREDPGRIFLDRACTQPFPLEIPPADRMRVHRIAVAHNVADRCAAFFPGSSGTLMFDSSLTGEDHYQDPRTCEPFCVGWLHAARGFVHVLDDASLDILLGARDTITDFLGYLRWKEDLVCTARTRSVILRYCGEEDLLANYLSVFKNGRHGFSLPNNVVDAFFLAEGDWVSFQSSPQRAAQLAADKGSYLWDELIEKFNKNILGGTSYSATTPLIADREKIMRFFAREPRVRRRMLADALLRLVEKTKNTYRGTRVVLPSNPGDPHYCFLVLPHPFGRPREEYRAVRGNLLEALCFVTKLVFPDALDIIGFATETGLDAAPRSEDSMYLDARNWNEEMEAHARALQADLGLLTNLTTSKDKVAEFPTPEVEGVVEPGPNPRNKPCPCGSGQKYKKCHGR